MKILTVSGLSLNVLGTLCLAKGLLLSWHQVSKIAGTYWNENPYLKGALIADRNWAIAGLILIGIGFLLQLIAELKGGS
jgi:hypothetical protein